MILSWLRRSQKRPKANQEQKRRRRLPKRLSRDEAASLLAKPDLTTWRGLRDRCMLELMYRAGLRVSEVVALRPRDVEESGAVHIWRGKGGVDRTSYFDPSTVWPLVVRWLGVRNGIVAAGLTSDAPLFCRERGLKLSTRAVQLMVARHRASAGIQGRCTPHSLRHTFASELLEEGFSTREVQELLGHASVATTELYTHVSSDRLSARVRGRVRDRIVE